VTQGPTQISNQLESELGRVDPDAFADDLKPGTQLLGGHYTIVGFLNSGGFGITYLAKDSLDRDVVIKECFPSSVCRRSKIVVAARSRAHTAELRSIVQLFVREARNLAKIVHPNIVAVHQVFEDNGTAYMAIDFIDGLDLQQVIDGEGPRLTPEHIVKITEKLLHAVGFIHDHDMLHRDISPDNVLIDKSGEPILIDFGAARDKASQSNRAMSALRVVKDGYSPQEFYIAGSEQGPWSDLYALGATLYHLISGDAPVNGQARLAALAEDRPDPYLPLTGRFPNYPEGFLEAIDRAMSTLPKQRLQSAQDWLAMFHSASAAPAGTVAAVAALVAESAQDSTLATAAVSTPPPLAKAASRPAEVFAESAPPSRGKGPVQIAAGVAAALIVVVAGYMMLGGKEPVPEAVASAAPTATAEPAETTGAKPAEPASAPAETATATPALAEEPATTEASAVPAEPAAQPEEAVAQPAVAVAEAAPAAEPETVSATEAAASTEAVAPTETVVAEAPAAPVGTPAANQIAFAAWDVEIPFASDDRMVDGKRVAVVTRIPPSVDRQEAGDWLAPGITIFAVNGTPIQSSGSITVAVMNAMSVDPDGKARLVVEYADASQERKSGLLTVSAVRLVNLQNGVSTRTSVVDGVWTTEVTGVTQPDITSLRQGDVLFRDKTSTTPLDGPAALEKIIADLIAAGTTQTVFSIIRDNKVSEARMQLVLDGDQ